MNVFKQPFCLNPLKKLMFSKYPNKKKKILKKIQKPEVTEIQTIQTLTNIAISPNGVKCFLMLNNLFGGR